MKASREAIVCYESIIQAQVNLLLCFGTFISGGSSSDLIQSTIDMIPYTYSPYSLFGWMRGLYFHYDGEGGPPLFFQ